MDGDSRGSVRIARPKVNDRNESMQEFEDPLSNFEPVCYESDLQEALAESPVDEIQSRPYAEIKSSATIRQALLALHGLRVASLLVVDDGQLKGIFTERDVLERVAEQYPRLTDRPVSEVMTKDPCVVYADDPAGTALAAIAAAGYRHVPVLDGSSEKLVGIVSPRRVFGFMEGKLGTE